MLEKTALVLTFNGVEEMEAIAPIDFMRRAGIQTTVAAHGPSPRITGRNGIHLTADRGINDALDRDYDCLVVPGGPGCMNLCDDEVVLNLLRKQTSSGRHIAAICAAPTLLQKAGALEGKAHTAHFSVLDQLPEALPDAAVVQDANVITSQGAGTAAEFALTLVARLAGEDKAQEVARSICYRSEISQP